MLISSESVKKIAGKLSSYMEIFCSGLFLSARWFVVSELDHDGIQLLVLPDKESAEYCAADLYHLIEGDKVFFLPDSGKSLEKSNYKSSLSVQRTSAIGKIIDHKEGQMVVVTYPSALEEGIPDPRNIRKSLLRLSVGDEISHEDIIDSLFESGFDRMCDVTMCVTAPSELKIKRIMERDGITREKAMSRLASQLTDDELRARCDIEIVNDGSGSLDAHIIEAVKKLNLNR